MKNMIKNFYVPVSARTEDSLALLWDKPEYAERIKEYQIYVNGELAGSTTATDYTLNGLQSATEYELYVQTVRKDGERGISSQIIKACTKASAQTVNILDFGAAADGKTVNTRSIQAAIDACPKGGKVLILKGTFVSGAIFLKSDMTLYLEEGAVLLGSTELEDYPVMKYRCEGNEILNYCSLINPKNPVDHLGMYDEAHYREIVELGGYVAGASRLHDITIEGKGVINANGTILSKKELAEKKGARGRAISLRNVDRVYLKDVTVRHSPAWCIHLSYCTDVNMNHIQVQTKYGENGERYDVYNGDGINPDSCQNVNIFHSLIASQDDSIAVKSGWDKEGRQVGIPTENVRITNCNFRSGFGVAMGSEMAGGIRNVLVQDCDFVNTYSIASVKAPRGRGSIIENVKYEDITFRYDSTELSDCEWFRGAIYVDQYYSYQNFDPDMPFPVNDGTPVIRNITFRNIELYTKTSSAIYLYGLPESPLQNIFLENIKASGRYGLKACNVEGLTERLVYVHAEEGEERTYRNVNRNSAIHIRK